MNFEPIINLSDDERQQLMVLAQAEPILISTRAKLILAYAQGKPTLQAAMEAGISRGRARYWKRQYISHGMAIFETQEKESSKLEVESETVAAVEENLEESRSPYTSQRIEDVSHAELPFPARREKIGIEKTDTLAEAGKKVWSYYFADMLSHEPGTLKGENIEELHDMRVATRRMRTAFDVFGSAYEAKILNRQLKGLRSIGRVLGRVRDMDVILENGIAYQKKAKGNIRPGLEFLLADWQQIIEQQRVRMIDHLASENYNEFKKSFNRFIQTEDTRSTRIVREDASNPLISDCVPALVYSRYAAVRAYESLVPKASVTQLHALRIEFKRFRYTLEYFREVLGEGIGKAINEIKQVQDHLGALHDADVACMLVSDFLKGWEKNQAAQPIQERQNPEPVVDYLAYLYSERYRLMLAFPGLWTQFSRLEFRHIIAEAITLL